MNKTTISEFLESSNIEIIQGLIKVNGGYVTSKILTDLGIHRWYLKIMLERGMIEKITTGVYGDKNIIADEFFVLQLRYPKIVYSEFTALYFYGLTEVHPSVYDVTVPGKYHVEYLNQKCHVYNCPRDKYDIGLTKCQTFLGNLITIYDRERCICDIIRFKKRLDLEQIKKSVKMYINSKEKNLNKLREYSKIFNVYEEVMEFIGMYYE